MPNKRGKSREPEDITKNMQMNKRPFSSKLKKYFTGVTFSKGQGNSFIRITGGKSFL